MAKEGCVLLLPTCILLGIVFAVKRATSLGKNYLTFDLIGNNEAFTPNSVADKEHFSKLKRV